MAIRIIEVRGSELCCRYQQGNPEHCFIEIDLEWNTLRARHRGGAWQVSFAAWEGRVRRYEIPPLKAEAANALMADLLPLAERMAAGYSPPRHARQWGHLSLEATAAEVYLKYIIDEGWRQWGEADVVSAWDGVKGLEAITAATTDPEIEALAEALSVYFDILDGFREAAVCRRDQLAAEAGESRLQPVAIVAERRVDAHWPPRRWALFSPLCKSFSRSAPSEAQERSQYFQNRRGLPRV